MKKWVMKKKWTDNKLVKVISFDPDTRIYILEDLKEKNQYQVICHYDLVIGVKYVGYLRGDNEFVVTLD